MKILMLSTDSLLFRSGSEVRERISLYGRYVEEMHIIVYTKDGFKEEKIAWNVHLYPTNTKIRPLFFFDAARALRRILKRNAIDLITSQDPFGHILAIFFGKIFKTKVQVQIHTDFLSPFFRRESFMNYLRYRAYSFSIRRADCVRVVSERLRGGIIKTYKVPSSKITVLPIFTDIERLKKEKENEEFRKKYKNFDFIVLMASRLTIEKNIPLALSAFALLVKKFPRACLVIVGDGPEKEKISRIVKELGIGFNVFLEGWVDNISGCLKASNLFLLTSNYEGYGRTIIEAFVLGVPVVSTNVGIAKEAGAYIAEGEERAIEKAIESFIKNKNENRKENHRIPPAYLTPSREEIGYLVRRSFEVCS
jgi:glycosyltransferase involved in cell wall biosynthesis